MVVHREDLSTSDNPDCLITVWKPHLEEARDSKAESRSTPLIQHHWHSASHIYHLMLERNRQKTLTEKSSNGIRSDLHILHKKLWLYCTHLICHAIRYATEALSPTEGSQQFEEWWCLIAVITHRGIFIILWKQKNLYLYHMPNPKKLTGRPTFKRNSIRKCSGFLRITIHN